MRSLSSRPVIMRSLGPVVSLREFQLLRGRVLAVRICPVNKVRCLFNIGTQPVLADSSAVRPNGPARK